MKSIFTLCLLCTICFQLSAQQAGCLAPADAVSDMTPNSEYDVNSLFVFDYIIQSTISGFWSDDDTSPPRERFFAIEYHVNTADGSLFFEGDILENIILSELPAIEKVKIHGSVRMSNGQMVTYLFDSTFHQHRAVTMSTNRNTEDLRQTQQQRAGGFFAVNPVDYSALNFEARAGHQPSSWAEMETDGWFHKGGLSPWTAISDEDGYETTLHLANQPGIAPIATNMPLVGLLAGILKHKDCNWLVVETTMEYTGEAPVLVRETINQVSKADHSFNGMSYKVLNFGASQANAPSQAQLQNQQSVYDDYMHTMTALGEKLVNCGGDKKCIAAVEKRMLELEMAYQNGQSGGTMYDSELRDLQGQLAEIEEQLIENDLECERLSNKARICRNTPACDLVEKQLKICQERDLALREQRQELNCEFAKLQGMGDMMEDCN